MKRPEIAQIRKFLSAKRNIVIVTHKNPDGDAIGSSLGLYNFFKKQKQRVSVITPNDYPKFLHWLPGNRQVVLFSQNKSEAAGLIAKAEIIFCLDFNNFKRIEDLGELVKGSKAVKVLIDHHVQPEKMFDHVVFDPSACSTAQLVFEFIEMLGKKKFIDKHVANCLYTGIMTDSLNFRINTTSARTHQVAAELIRSGAENARAYSEVFDTNTENRMKLLGYCISEKMKVLPEYHAAYISLSEEELNRFHFQKGDTEGVVNYPLSIQGIVFSAFFMERDGEIKISLRSRGKFDVNRIARKYFNGGGHVNAAGGDSRRTLSETIGAFLQLLPEHKEELS